MNNPTPSTSEAKAVPCCDMYGGGHRAACHQHPGNLAYRKLDDKYRLTRELDEAAQLSHQYRNERDQARATIARLESERDEAARLSHQYRNESERLTSTLSAIRVVAALGSKHHKAPFDETPCARRYDSIVERIDALLTPKEGARE